MNLNNLLVGFQKLTIQKSPQILIGLGVASMITCVVCAIKTSPKSKEIWETKEHEVHTKKNTYNLKYVDDTGENALSYYCGSDFRGRLEYASYVIRDFTPVWLPTIVAGAASIGFFIAANHIHVKRQAMLAAAYTLSEKALSTYQKKVVETVGEKKHLEMIDSISNDRVRENPYKSDSVIITTYGDTRFYDAWSGRYFLSDINAVRKAENEICRRLPIDMCCTVNDYYLELGLPPIPGGSIVGWDVNDISLEVNYSPVFDTEGHPCTALSFLVGVLESKHRVL